MFSVRFKSKFHTKLILGRSNIIKAYYYPRLSSRECCVRENHVTLSTRFIMISSPYLSATKASSPARTVTSVVAKRLVGSHHSSVSSPVAAADAAAAAAAASAAAAAAAVAASREDRRKAAVANNARRLNSFRRIVHERVSARRFKPDVPVPDDVWKDILRMTRVSEAAPRRRWFRLFLRRGELTSHPTYASRKSVPQPLARSLGLWRHSRISHYRLHHLSLSLLSE